MKYRYAYFIVLASLGLAASFVHATPSLAELAAKEMAQQNNQTIQPASDMEKAFEEAPGAGASSGFGPSSAASAPPGMPEESPVERYHRLVEEYRLNQMPAGDTLEAILKRHEDHPWPPPKK